MYIYICVCGFISVRARLVLVGVGRDQEFGFALAVSYAGVVASRHPIGAQRKCVRVEAVKLDVLVARDVRIGCTARNNTLCSKEKQVTHTHDRNKVTGITRECCVACVEPVKLDVFIAGNVRVGCTARNNTLCSKEKQVTHTRHKQGHRHNRECSVVCVEAVKLDVLVARNVRIGCTTRNNTLCSKRNRSHTYTTQTRSQTSSESVVCVCVEPVKLDVLVARNVRIRCAAAIIRYVQRKTAHTHDTNKATDIIRECCVCVWNRSNLMCLLQETSGLGVPPAIIPYVRKKNSSHTHTTKTRSQT